MIYLIITSSIIDKDLYTKKDDEFRKETYLNSIRTSLDMLPSEITPIIVENNGKRETYLDNFGLQVFYTTNNIKPVHCHKAINEIEDIKDVIKEYNIQDDDIIIKLTGRYKVYHPFFFNFVHENQMDYDVFIKFFNVTYMQYNDNDCVMGLFAMRCKYIKKFKFIEKIGEQGNPSAEVQFCNYIKSSNCRIHKMDYLYATFCFADDLLVTDI